MTRVLRLTIRIACALLAIVFVSASLPASAACPALEKVEWWTNSVPEVRRVVVVTYKGSWDNYIDRWRRELDMLQRTLARGAAVEIKSRGIVLRDIDLKEYINRVELRIKALECLKREYADDDDVIEIETAAGSEGTSSAAPVKQELAPARSVAAISGAEINLEVAAICEGAVPAFQVTNLGGLWPRLAEVSIHRTDTNGKLVMRRLRMANSQQMIFKVPEARARDLGEVGIFIEPSWYDRPFAYDAKLKC